MWTIRQQTRSKSAGERLPQASHKQKPSHILCTSLSGFAHPAKQQQSHARLAAAALPATFPMVVGKPMFLLHSLVRFTNVAQVMGGQSLNCWQPEQQTPQYYCPCTMVGVVWVFFNTGADLLLSYTKLSLSMQLLLL